MDLKIVTPGGLLQDVTRTVDVAKIGNITNTDLDAHSADTTSVHGITDTAQVALKNAANTFTENQTIAKASPSVILDATAASPDGFLRVTKDGVNSNTYLAYFDSETAWAYLIAGNDALKVAMSGTTIKRNGGLFFNNGSNVLDGSGTPEGAVTAPVGSIYLRTNGGTATTLYVKESGSGNTGWVAVGAATLDYGTTTELTDLDSGAESAGTDDKVARADHKHAIANDAITYAKMQNVSAASRLLGRGSAAGSGDPQEITLGTGLSMSGTTLNGTAAGVGDLLDWQFVRKTATEDISSSTTLQDDDHLLIALGTNQVWVFEATIFATTPGASNNPDIKIGFTIPASASITWGGHGLAEAASGGTTGDLKTSYVTSGSIPFGIAANPHAIHISGIVVTAGTSGNLQLQWAQNVSDGSATRVDVNSFILARRVS